MVPRVFLLFVTARVVTFGVVLGFSPTTLLPFSHSYSSWMPPPTTQNEFSTRQHNTLVGKLSEKSSHENDEPDDTNHVGDGRAVNRRDVMVKGAASFAAATVAWGGDMGGTEHASGLWVPKSAHAATTTTTTTITAPTEPRVVVPTTKLGSLTVSRTIQGYWQLAGGHGKYKETDAIDNMNAHYNAGMTTLDTADIYGPSELIVGTFVKKKQPKAVPCTKFCCFRYLEEIDKTEVRNRIQKVNITSYCTYPTIPILHVLLFFLVRYMRNFVKNRTGFVVEYMFILKTYCVRYAYRIYTSIVSHKKYNGVIASFFMGTSLSLSW
jgi:hypothetical protein